jgi:hypothetical protein
MLYKKKKPSSTHNWQAKQKIKEKKNTSKDQGKNQRKIKKKEMKY